MYRWRWYAVKCDLKFQYVIVLLTMSWLCIKVECTLQKLQIFQKYCYAGENEVIIHNQIMHVQCFLSSKWLQWMKFNFHLAVVIIIRVSYEIPWIINRLESLEIYLSPSKCWAAVRIHLSLTANELVQSLQVEIVFFQVTVENIYDLTLTSLIFY